MRFPSRLCICAAVVGAIAVFAGSASTAPPASAALGVLCSGATTHAFAPWGDSTSYWFVTNGGLENGATGWTLTGGAAVVGGNESFSVHGTSDSHSLSLPAGSTATAPAMCVGALSTTMRFFAANTANPTAKLEVHAIYHGGLGQVLGVADYGTVQGGAWHPSKQVILLGGLLPLLTQSVQFRFSPVGNAAGWRIDDAYFDPLLHR
jgi:streptogramin lyase